MRKCNFISDYFYNDDPLKTNIKAHETYSSHQNISKTTHT
jgi:hypothetical protein